MSALIVIPARWGSSRLPGKPLQQIAGRTLLERVIDRARRGADGRDARVVVATEDRRVADHAEALGCAAVLTEAGLPSGSDRALAAAIAFDPAAERIVNLQGDAPFMAADTVRAVLDALRTAPSGCVTPVVELDWPALDALRERKARTPSSGTTCVTDAMGRALWFSKAILPAIRDERQRREAGPLSPVRQHIGLYGYTLAALRRFCAAEPTAQEIVEGLEQLRLVELGIPVQTVVVAPPRIQMSGIDTPRDVLLAEELIARHGDPHGRDA